eukprot:CAMPEP_0179371212 /NCGR_PEP_ID=MMETSP0797-20121207/85602_1 /TAXON_ID=47934 /ORGANISM="Dinophysis acuminata, Strain DAEP01" /LENGTH=510 /DNA_ID=CAMNT_0021087043 /DNA_START=69 /DNA_END=1601 /DNA_ORIENTATION=+
MYRPPSRYSHVWEPEEPVIWECKHCRIEGTEDEIVRPGPHHKIAQGCFRRGFVAEHDGRMACPRAEGAAFKCGKYGCTCEFIVMWGFVWHLYPDRPMRFASRGPDHTVRSGCHHHDYWCDMGWNGTRSVENVIRQENEKARRVLEDLTNRITASVGRFSMGVDRLLNMLPHIENNLILQVGSPALLLPDQPTLMPFHDTASQMDCEAAFDKQYHRLHESQGALRSLVTSIHLVRCLQLQVGRQRLDDRRQCIEKLFAFLGRAHFLPKVSGFMCKEVDAPPVIEEVQHSEPAATVDEHMASVNVEHKLADNVTALRAQGPAEHAPGADAGSPAETEEIHLLEYSRHPESFRRALCEGPPLQPCRSALEAAGHRHLLGSGAKMFVHPDQYVQTCVAIVEQGFNLRPFHVVVAKSLEYHVEACLADLSYRQGARVKRRTVIHETGAPGDNGSPSSVEAASDGSDADEEHGYSKTFLCAAPPRRNADSVTQSTTEAHSGGLNPRRVRAASLSGS